MIVDLTSVGDGTRPFEFTVKPEDLELGTEGIQVAADVMVRGELKKSASQVDVSAHVVAPLAVACTRCLNDVQKELDFNFHAGFVASEFLPTEREVQVSGRDLDTDVLDGNEIDLTDLIREQILLNLPDQVFCREDCLGICAGCGADLNTGRCHCSEGDIDPRWAALKDLRK
jgi:uncharacterized protein